MNRRPRRTTLVEQAAEILRHDLASGRWGSHMPGEHALSKELEISRSTLRVALDLLRREGLVEPSRGRRRRINHGVAQRGPSASKTVAFISSLPIHEQAGRSVVIAGELRRHLHAAGFDLEWQVVPQANKRAGERRLRALVDQTHAAAWILSSCSIELQQWFERAGLPTLVQGSCHEGVNLPHIRIDGAAACRHAVGQLRARGHRRIALLLPRSPFAGATEIEASFRACCQQPAMRAQAQVRYHEPNVTGVEQAMAALMQSAARPTALIVMMPADTLSVYCYLLRHGFALPRDISLVSLLDDFYLARITPAISRYTSDNYPFARRMARLLAKIIARDARPRSISIFPDFIAGATIGPPPAVN